MVQPDTGQWRSLRDDSLARAGPERADWTGI